MDLRELIESQTGFSLRLANHVGATLAAGSNLVFSPLSVHVLLALVAAGSKGATRDQILSVLGTSTLEGLSSLASQTVAVVLANGSAGGGPRVVFANGLWVDASVSLKSSFKEIVSGVYKAESKAVDFRTKANEVTQEVNAWVRKATSGLVEVLLPSGSVDSNTRLVLGNALYFKGDWVEKFDANKTTDCDFHLLDGRCVRVPFMNSKEKQFICSRDDFKVLKLPYKQGSDGRQFSLYMFLPNAQDGLRSLLGKLSDTGSLHRILPVRKVPVEKFMIPKFKIEFGFEASEVLKGMGLVSPFSVDCDLTEMVDSVVGRNLYVSSIFHNSFIEVNEEGTEAAAASAAVVTERSLPAHPVEFVADHPFLFLIREDMTGVVIFVGLVLNPSVAV